MPDCSAPDSPPATELPPVTDPCGPGHGARLLSLWHRIRSGEDPAAFGAVVVVLALAAGLLWFWMGARDGGVPPASAAPGAVADRPLPSQTPPSGNTTSTGPGVTVHVAGAVSRPGLLHLPAGSRVADALATAGGSLPASRPRSAEPGRPVERRAEGVGHPAR